MATDCQPGGGMVENYFSIDDILMSSERLPCTFKAAVKGLGFLDTSSGKKDIAVGTKMDLPLWLALSLSNWQKKVVDVEYTKSYKAKYREILKADASVVDLHKLGPYFYAFGQQLLILNHSESVLLAKCLVMTFSDRFRKLMDWSNNVINCDNSLRLQRLDEVERRIFKIGQKSLQTFFQWEAGESRKLEASELVSRHRKRKRDATN